jgi:hypothetical protein
LISRRRQHGQVLALMAVLLPAIVLGLGLVVDTALVFKARREALALADGAAQHGAAQIDESAKRADVAAPSPIDVAVAESKARQYVLLQRQGAIVDTVATPREIRVTVTLQVPTIVWHLPGQSNVAIQASANAQPFTGVVTGQAP